MLTSLLVIAAGCFLVSCFNKPGIAPANIITHVSISPTDDAIAFSLQSRNQSSIYFTSRSGAFTQKYTGDTGTYQYWPEYSWNGGYLYDLSFARDSTCVPTHA